MNLKRPLFPILPLSLMLAACSSDPSLSASTYVPPSPPTQTAIVSVATATAAEAKLAAPLQISAVRQTDHGGPGQYFICLREANPPSDKRQRYYSIFFDNDTSKGSRLSVIMDDCETQAFSPLPTAAPTIPAANAKPARKKAARSSTQ
jgi:hypothetical protein